MPSLLRPCLACTRSKVKCDKCQPCGRCLRLGLRCVEAAPSRRGMRRAALSPASAELRAFPESSLEGLESESAGDAHLMDMELRRPAPDGLVTVEQVRIWFLIALRRGSTFLLARAFLLAARARIGVFDIFEPGARAPRPGSEYASDVPPGNAVFSLVESGIAAERAVRGVPPAKRPRTSLRPTPGASAAASLAARSPASLPVQIRAHFGAPNALAYGRVAVDGAVKHFCTPAFGARVATAATMDRVYEAGQGDVHAIFIADAQGVDAVARLHARLFQGLSLIHI